MKLSEGEKLILMMLADVIDGSGIESDVDTNVVRDAVSGGHAWALKWAFPGIFEVEEDDEATVRETVEILNMCRVVENSIAELSDEEREQIPEQDRLVFVGFDGNHDEHHGVALTLIVTLGRWSEFVERSMNSHSTVLPSYRNMLARYEHEGGAVKAPFSLAQIKAIINFTD